MNPGTTDGGPLAGTAVEKITTATKQHDHCDRATVSTSTATASQLVAFAKVLLGDTHAAQDQLVVEHCPVPGCNYAHRHVVPTGMWRQPLLKAPRCKPWLRYRVEVVAVVPVPAVAAGLRKRGAA